ncbi:Tetracycline resistance protein, class B [compost metagenome]
MSEPVAPSQSKRLLGILFLTLFLVMTGFGIVIPALPYQTLELQGDSRTVGFLLASYSLMNVLCAPLWGRLSDRIGRKPVLLVGILGLASSFLWFGLGTELWQLFAARLLGGTLGAAALPTAMAYAGDITTPEARAKAIGILGAGLGLGMVVGPALGGLAGHWGHHVPFFAASGLAVITALLVFVILPSRPPETPQYKPFFEAFRETGGKLWPFYTLTFLQMLAFTNLEATFVLYAKDRFGLSILQVGLMFMAMGLVSAGFQGGGVAKLIGRFGASAVGQAGIVLLGISFGLIPLAPHPAWLLGAFCLTGIGAALIRTSLATGVSRGATAGQGTAMGLMQSFDSLARVFGPMLGGILYALHQGLPYLMGLGLMGLAAVLAFFLLPRERHDLVGSPR